MTVHELFILLIVQMVVSYKNLFVKQITVQIKWTCLEIYHWYCFQSVWFISLHLKMCFMILCFACSVCWIFKRDLIEVSIFWQKLQVKHKLECFSVLRLNQQPWSLIWLLYLISSSNIECHSFSRIWSDQWLLTGIILINFTGATPL